MTIATKALRTRMPPRARRAQLLHCALAAFAEHGIARATHSHVAERACVSVSAVYSYFRTRDDLVEATLGEVEAYLDNIAADFLGADKPVYDVLVGLAQGFAADSERRPDLIKVWLDWSTGVDATTWARYLEVLDRLHAAARRVFERGKKEGLLSDCLDESAAARIYIGGGHTVALMQFAGVSHDQLDKVIDQLVRGVMGIGMDTAVHRSLT